MFIFLFADFLTDLFDYNDDFYNGRRIKTVSDVSLEIKHYFDHDSYLHRRKAPTFTDSMLHFPFKKLFTPVKKMKSAF